MSINPKDLQDILSNLGEAFQPGDVGNVAQSVGGKVIENTPPATKNAKLMTAMLGGGGGSSGQQSVGSPSIPTSAPTVTSDAPTGSQSRPFNVNVSQEMCRNEAFQPGDVGNVAQSVGGKVIENTPPATKNAKLMTAMLGGGGRQSTATGTSIPTSTATGTSDAPTGSQSRPFSVNISQETCRNLAKQIVDAQKGGPQQSTLQKFLGGFGQGAEQAGSFSPLRQAGGWASRKIKGMFGGGEQGEAATEPMPNAVMEIANRNAQRIAKFSPTANKLRAEDDLASQGIVSKRGFHDTIKGPGPIQSAEAARAAGKALRTGEAVAVEGGMGAAAKVAGQFAGKLAGGVLVFAEMVAETIGVIKALQGFANATIEGNAHLAQWNGQLAIAQAQAGVSAIYREAHMAGATGGSASSLVSENTALSEEFQPIAESLTSLKNLTALGGVEIARLLTMILKPINDVFGPLLQAIEQYLGSGKATSLPMEDLFNYLKGARGYGAADEETRRNALDNARNGMQADRPAPASIPGVVDPNNAWRRRI